MILICLSTYNGEKYLREFLTSLETQSEANWMLLIRDDGSRDNTLPLLRNFKYHHPLQVQIVEDNVNLGAKSSFAHLLNIALGNPDWEYLMFADQDDVWLKDKIALTRTKMEQMTQQFGTSTPLLVHTDLKVTDAVLTLVAESFWKYQNVDSNQKNFNNFLVNNNITGCTMMINRTLAILSQPIPTEAIMHDWWIALTASAFGYIDCINIPTILYRQHGKNDTGASRYDWRFWVKRFFKRPSMEHYILQSKAFLEIHHHHLLSWQRIILNDIVHLPQMNWWKRRQTLIKHKVLKNGLIRNIGLMLFS